MASLPPAISRITLTTSLICWPTVPKTSTSDPQVNNCYQALSDPGKSGFPPLRTRAFVDTGSGCVAGVEPVAIACPRPYIGTYVLMRNSENPTILP